MKKALSLLLVLVLCLSLCACGKSEAVAAYENRVAEIGTVTLASKELILAAEEAYNALTEKEKQTVVETKAVLAAKRAEYDDLVAAQKARLDSVVALIDAIGTVTLNSEAAISAAESAYDALSADEKAMVSEAYQKLIDARAAYKAANAAEASNAIDAIGKVTLDSKEAIAAARTLYDALTEEEKTLVTNYATLVAAEAEYVTAWEAEKQRIIGEYSKKFEIENDPIEGISWYMHADMPNYIDIRSYIIPYIGVRGNNTWMCIRYNYTADSWIFWEQLTIMVDGVKYYKLVGYYDTIRDNDSEVWEYWDECLNYNQAMDSNEIQMLKAIADSKETIIRFQGDEYHYDLYVNDADKKMIKDTLTLYEAMLG